MYNIYITITNSIRNNWSFTRCLFHCGKNCEIKPPLKYEVKMFCNLVPIVKLSYLFVACAKVTSVPFDFWCSFHCLWTDSQLIDSYFYVRCTVYMEILHIEIKEWNSQRILTYRNITSFSTIQRNVASVVLLFTRCWGTLRGWRNAQGSPGPSSPASASSAGFPSCPSCPSSCCAGGWRGRWGIRSWWRVLMTRRPCGWMTRWPRALFCQVCWGKNRQNY